ncbi:transcriptional regulator SUPERMAN-like [Panicum virgatum]|uniref:C2H2-type domain-containing protein n=1 Tax=Panicum virgatum TaxID=38727 RepID=A0A8T0V388_PANVG|nr:transcriptional regulator SUPERMAN-like [Panicum virgatum]KAG2631151.1 hypothetical protein PVAP13_2NG006100 [Panicum virgatum]
MEQMAKYYWAMLGASRTATAAATSSGLRSWPPPAHAGEPSWEELAFAQDAAGHLGGCVWPPRSYTCTFCRREFRSAQALGGHMNVHRRDRARLRQCASPDHEVIQDAQKQQSSIASPPADHQLQLQPQPESPLFRPKQQAVLISGPKSTFSDHQSCNKEGAVISTTTSPSFLSTIIKESTNKVVISVPAATAGSKQALEIDDDDEEEEEIVAERRRKRRRRVVHQQPEALLPLFFLRSSKGVEHDAKVPQVIIRPSPNSSSLHLAGRQEVDLELRLGSSIPKVA